jgi:eukaryotic-like serine/threonine-protein kinase
MSSSFKESLAVLGSPCPGESLLASFVEGALDAQQASALEEHVDACRSCYEVLATYATAYLTSRERAQTWSVSRGGSGVLDRELVQRLQRSRPLTPGSVVGRYVVLGSVGEGASGVVYAAYDPELDRKIALKVLSPRGGAGEAGDRSVYERVSREGRAMAKLAHPHVVSVHDVGSVGEHVFIAMEFVDGSTLRAWLEEHPPGKTDVERAFLDAGRGLAAAHAAGLVHRDFKPDNVLVGKDGSVKVTDFGLACAPRSPATEDRVGLPSGSTWTDAIAGTPAYMAPEQREGRPADARSDQYSFCVALHEALFGRHPSAPAKASRPAVRVSKRLRAAIARGLSVRPADRFASMSELLRALESDGARPRRTAIAFAAALVVGLGAWGVGYAASSPRRTCSEAAAGMRGVWDEVRKREASAAFHATGLPYADDAWRVVQNAGDAYAAAWTAARSDACEATRVRGEQSDAMFTLRTECLDRRLGELRAASDLLARADRDVVEHAAAAVSRLPPIASCNDTAELVASVRPPEDPEVKKRVVAMRQELDRVRALEAAGKYKDALPDARRDALTAGAIAYRPIQAEALYLRGVLESDTTDYATAVSTFYDAVGAAEAGRDDELAAEIWTALVALLGRQLDRFAEADQCAARAAAAVERTGGRGMAALLLPDAEATVCLERGRFADAVQKAREALAIQEKVLGPRDLRVATTLRDLGTALLHGNDLGEAHAVLTRSLEIREERLGDDHPDVASTLLSLGISYLSVGRYDEAVTHFERALAIRERILGPNSLPVSEVLQNLVGALRWSGEARRALPFAERALRIARAPGGLPDLEAGSLNRIGLLRTALGEYDLAKSSLEQALEIHEGAFGRDNPKVLPELCNLGRVALAQKDYAVALERFERAHVVCEKTFLPDSPDQADTLVGIAVARLGMGRADLALPLLERAHALREPRPGPPRMLAEVRFALARALWDTGDRDRAMKLAAQALDGYTAAGRGLASERSEVSRWLAAHAGA